MSKIRDDLANIYRDFYGPAGESGKSLNRNKTPNDKGKYSDLILEADTSAEKRSEPANAGQSRDEAAKPEEFNIQIETVDSGEESKTAAATNQSEDDTPKEPEKSGMEELEELIGLKSVKHDVEELIGLAKVQKMRQDKGMKSVPVSLHLVFSGNPGTGKTTVARILAKLYKEIGILEGGQLVETDRSGLVAGYVGQTAIKTQGKIQEAMGGILFIDEAYTLNQEGENYGQEAIDTILKAMEDHRDKFVVIVAGYTELMKEFVDSNPGLRSRFNKFFEFPDYTVDELKEIFMLQCSKYQYKLSDDAMKAVSNEIVRMESSKGENFANARAVRNLFEKIITNQASRITKIEDLSEDDLTLITADDLKDLDQIPDDTAEENAKEILELIKGMAIS